ncbi:MAG: macrolide ABC transporter ATP-binding protein [candidate division Zixibacteria bacterium HGW-Zixibacteria-1]|nr:MAG: macrolide ABC transporter ATP-binding protein [candidate division Zixibacteria bacterium HGW-Zixibacteria-1]
MGSSWIKTIDLCRYYTRGRYEVRAVDNVSLSLEKGEFLAIVGASGSGKSTLLNLIAGLDSPTAGRIEFEGIALNSLSRKELASYRAHKVGMIFQSFNLMAHLTALENVERALFFNDTPRRRRKEMALEILDRLGMSDRIDHHPADLSGGEQQRVAVARALVKNPEILFADEPTGNLDRDNSIQIADLITDLNRRGLTIVMVTHDLDMAGSYAARMVRMNYGRVIDDSEAAK